MDTKIESRAEISQKIIEGLHPITGKYSLIVCDPPWGYSLRDNDKSHRGRCPYPSMSDEAILKMPINEIAEKNAYLLLWVTNNHFGLGFKCLEAWGFKDKAIFTWEKVTKYSTEENPHLHIGIGHYGRNCTEHFIIAMKGKKPSFTHLGLTNIPNVIHARRGQHSEKPKEFWEIADRLRVAMGNTEDNSIELFARKSRENWTTWGTLEND